MAVLTIPPDSSTTLFCTTKTMNTSTKLLSCALLLLCFVGVSRAQNKACPIPPPSPYKHTAYIATRYDETANVMRTVLEHPLVLGDAAQPVYLSASFAYGKEAKNDSRFAPRTVVNLALISVAAAPRFRQSHALRLFADGHEQPTLAAERYLTQTDELNRTIEFMQISLSVATLRALTQGKRVEAKLGAERFTLTENHLEALRDLLSLTRPPAFAPATRRDGFLLPQSGY